jgi:hypothetical protein
LSLATGTLALLSALSLLSTRALSLLIAGTLPLGLRLHNCNTIVLFQIVTPQTKPRASKPYQQYQWYAGPQNYFSPFFHLYNCLFNFLTRKIRRII